jgi:hypothetical protein
VAPVTRERDMTNGNYRIWRQAAAALLTTLALAACGVRANASETPYVKGRLVQVDVYDRADGMALPVYAKNGRSYILGTPGHEYAVRIRNCTNGRVLVATSVDGVNVVSGETAAPTQTGYVLDPWSSVEIAGWLKGRDRTAAFYFTDLGDSYAARTGRPLNVGVIGVAVFQEKAPPIVRRDFGSSVPRLSVEPRSDPAPLAGRPDATDNMAQSSPAAPSRERAEMAPVEPDAPYDQARAAKALGKLGTGHGRSESTYVTTVAFERATESPVEIIAVQYDRRDNLIALGVLPRPYYAQQRQPDPFPDATRYVPDPTR